MMVLLLTMCKQNDVSSQNNIHTYITVKVTHCFRHQLADFQFMYPVCIF